MSDTDLIVMARKPLSEKNIAHNVLRWGTGGINIDECRIKYQSEDDKWKNNLQISTENSNNGWKRDAHKKPIERESNSQGRFPANLILDEEAGKLLDEQSGKLNKQAKCKTDNKSGWQNEYVGGDKVNSVERKLYLDEGGASRFFYCPKVSKRERNEGIQKNTHPTLKPVDLMAYLVRMVTPKGGTVLDPFMGSGSTGKAAVREGMSFIGIEREDEYMEIAEARIEWEQKQHNYRNFWE